jgi:cyclin-dependent kinase-like
LIQKVLGSLTKDQSESFAKNPRFVGLKFPNLPKAETLQKKYLGKLSKKALDLMVGLLKMDPQDRLTGEQAIFHEWFEDLRANDPDQSFNQLIVAPV